MFVKWWRRVRHSNQHHHRFVLLIGEPFASRYSVWSDWKNFKHFHKIDGKWTWCEPK